jgi:hypothetical protein
MMVIFFLKSQERSRVFGMDISILRFSRREWVLDERRVEGPTLSSHNFTTMQHCQCMPPSLMSHRKLGRDPVVTFSHPPCVGGFLELHSHLLTDTSPSLFQTTI